MVVLVGEIVSYERGIPADGGVDSCERGISVASVEGDAWWPY